MKRLFENLFSRGRIGCTAAVTCMLCAVLISGTVSAQQNVRRHLNFPDIEGYQTLACDLHMHTVFSDGNVWPSVRVQEAWLEGIDAIAITDHYEYTPHEDDIPPNFSRSYEIAKPFAEASGMILIPGGEITRAEPQGHHNAIFLPDIAAPAVPDSIEAVRLADSEGAFVFWNHPGWQNPGKKSIWSAAQDTIFDNGWLDGIEVVNGKDYYPNAHRWCIEKGLTILGNSDIHQPVTFDYDIAGGGHRSLTLVFAGDRTRDGIRDALDDRRTVVWWNDMLIGEALWLEPVFDASVHVSYVPERIAPGGNAYLQVTNTMDVPVTLNRIETEGALLSVRQQTVEVAARGTALLQVQASPDARPGRQTVYLRFEVPNLLIAPDTGLTVDMPVKATFAAARQ